MAPAAGASNFEAPGEKLNSLRLSSYIALDMIMERGCSLNQGISSGGDENDGTQGCESCDAISYIQI